MMWLTLLFSIVLQAATPAPPVVVVFETDLGKFEVAVDVAHAPITAANFLKYVDGGGYDGGYFHRSVRTDNDPKAKTRIEVVQASRGGRMTASPPIPLERTNATGLKHLAGTISMARAARPDSAVSDFFVCVSDTPSLDFGGERNADGQGFAAFGQIVSGMDVINKIHQSPTNDKEDMNQQILIPRIWITKAYRKK